MFGSVTTGDIADGLKAQGFTIDKRQVQIAEPLKTLGEFPVTVKVFRDVTAEIKVTSKKKRNTSRSLRIFLQGHAFRVPFLFLRRIELFRHRFHIFPLPGSARKIRHQTRRPGGSPDRGSIATSRPPIRRNARTPIFRECDLRMNQPIPYSIGSPVFVFCGVNMVLQCLCLQKAGLHHRRTEAHQIFGGRKKSSAGPFVAVVHVRRVLRVADPWPVRRSANAAR